MKAKSMMGTGIILAILFIISSCLPWGKKKEEERLYEKGKEGRWVYSEQRPSSYDERKRAVTYSKRPYGAEEGEVVRPQPTVTPYLLGRLKYKVVVLEFQDQTKEGRRGLGAIVAQELAKQLEESEAVVLVDINMIKKSLGEIDITELTEPFYLWKMKTLLGVHALVTGSINDVLIGGGQKGRGKEALAVAKIEARLLDADTGNVIRSVKGENPIFTSRAIGEFSRDKALLKAINFALRGVKEGILRGLAGLEWSTSVASVQADKVYLNAGKSSGLKIGDVLKVFDPGKEIRHPITNIPLGRIPGQLKGKIKIVRFFGFDASEAQLIQGENISPGDMVKMVKE
ncbi:MAG: hypothetical protein DRG50_00600 [Deltaproteobacteria bacterium]|nr:MAG: hypothetical protein DRG50_00600 [Deltaproteobacteria bacterium]